MVWSLWCWVGGSHGAEDGADGTTMYDRNWGQLAGPWRKFYTEDDEHNGQPSRAQ